MLIGMFPAWIGAGEGDESGAGGDSGADSQTTDQQTNGATDTGAGGGDGWKPPASQAELDRIIVERAKRAEEAAVRKLLEQSGAKSPDELVAAHKARADADHHMSPSQRLGPTADCTMAPSTDIAYHHVARETAWAVEHQPQASNSRTGHLPTWQCTPSYSVRWVGM